MATFTDDFNRADEAPLNSPYTSVVGAGLILSTNSVKSVDGGSYYIDALIGEDYDDDQYAEVELGTLGIFDSAGVGVRFDASGSGYAVRFEPAGPDVYLDSFSSGVQSELTVLENVTFSTGDTIGLGVVGNVLTIYRNGGAVGTFTDTSSNHTSGVPALSYRRNNNGSTTIDNFSADGLVEARSIVNVDTDNTVVDGQQDVPFTVADFAGDITGASLRVGTDTLALTGLVGTGTSYTVNMPDLSTFADATAGLPLTSASHQVQLEVTDGTDTATIDIDYLPKTGWAVQEITGGVSVKGSVFEGRTGGAPANTSQVYYPTASNTSISATGVITTDVTGDSINGVIYYVTAKEWETFAASFAEATDTTTPVLTVVPSTTVYNLTVGDSFTPPVVSVADTDVNGDPVTATVTPTIVDSRNGQGVGTVTYTYNYTDGTNPATPIVVTANYAAVVVVPTVITVSGQSVTTIAFNGTLPVFTTSTNDGSTVTVGGDTPVNNVAGTYVVTFDAPNAVEVTRTVIVEAEVIVTPPTNAALMREIARAEFILDGETRYTRYSGRANQASFKFTCATASTNINFTSSGHFDFGNNSVSKVEIIAGESSISSEAGAILIENENLYAELGLLTGIGNPALRVVVFIEGHDKGVVMCGPNLRSSPIIIMQ